MPRDRPPGIWESLKRALAGAEPRPPERPDVTLEADAISSAPPFLLPDDAPAVADPPALPPAREQPPTFPVSPPEPSDSTGRPRLARGLASFSRSNADREKKFAHLLHDDPSGEKKKPQPPGDRD